MTNKKIILFLLVILFSCRNNSTRNNDHSYNNWIEDTIKIETESFSKEDPLEYTYLSNNPKKLKFNLMVSGKEPHKKQDYFVTDSLVINQFRYIQIIDNKVFRDLINMDYYTYRIKDISFQNDSIISFTLDKEGSEFEEKSLIKWFEPSEYMPHSVALKRKKNSIFWELYYDNIIQGIYKDYSKGIIDTPILFIEDKDVKTSGFPIWYDDEEDVYR